MIKGLWLVLAVIIGVVSTELICRLAVWWMRDLTNPKNDHKTYKTILSKKVVCICPFHAEKTPSFVISTVDHTYFCVSCGERGILVSTSKPRKEKKDAQDTKTAKK